jgi:2-amino-4-hydroxy-6-hydroxymethyldihydropteridine diphosphokinase
MVRAAVALGSNLGDRPATLNAATGRLAQRLAHSTVSRYFETAPVGVGEQPAFLNAAMVGDWDRDPRSLLELLMRLEQEAGRMRPHAGAARTLDLDLILFGTAEIDEPGLTVPHPRFRERGFVLEPLAEIAPDMVDPVTGRTVADLYRAWRER